MTYFPKYKIPFIFSNFNGTAGDVDVLTHEFGHSFQAYMARNIKIPEYRSPTMESCEIDSMSMEFFAEPYMSLEVIIDFILSHRENQFQRIDKVLKLSNQDLRKISRMWYEMNVEVQHLPHVHPKSYYYALKDFRFTEKHGWDKTGKKKALAKVIFGKESLGYGMRFRRSCIN